MRTCLTEIDMSLPCFRIVAVIALLALAAVPEATRAEVRVWRLGGDGEDWRANEFNSSALDFGGAGSIEILGFASDDNIAQRLVWSEGSPRDYISERASALIWDSLTLKRSNAPLVDGDVNTSSDDRFKRFGASQEGHRFFIDLGAPFPVRRFLFFPRQSGADDSGRPYSSDFIRSYQVRVSDGDSYNEENPPRPIYDLITRVEFTREDSADVVFPLQVVRFLQMQVLSTNPFEIAEFQLFGSGFAPRATYLSKVVDLGEAANYSKIEWDFERLRREEDVVIIDSLANAELSIRMRTGADQTPLVYHEIVNRFTNEQVEVSENAYNSLPSDLRGVVEEDLDGWSTWSAPLSDSPSRVGLPSPRQFFQLEVSMESLGILEGLRLKTVDIEYFVPPLANGVLGEVSLLEEPAPPGDVTIAPAGVFARFAYDILADVDDTSVGFNALRIFTSESEPKLVDFLVGDPPESVVPDSIAEEPGSLVLFFPSRRVVSRAGGTLRVIFDAQVFVQGSVFNAEVFDTDGEDSPQVVLPGDANPEVLTNRLQVLTSDESARDLLPFFEVTPKAFSPNGDGVNDLSNINVTLVQLVLPVDVDVEVFNLAGRRVRSLFSGEEIIGAHSWSWNGRGDNGEVVPPGIYLVAVRVGAGREILVRTGTIALAY